MTVGRYKSLIERLKLTPFFNQSVLYFFINQNSPSLWGTLRFNGDLYEIARKTSSTSIVALIFHLFFGRL